MITLHLLWPRIKLGESEPVPNGLMLHLSIVLHALSARERLHCQPIVSSLGSPFQHPRFALYTVPTHCLAPRCPLSQTGMTLGELPAAQVEMSGRAGSAGFWQTHHAMSDQGGEQRLARAGSEINKHETRRDAFWETLTCSPLLARQSSAQDRETWSDNWTRWWWWSSIIHFFFRLCRFVRDERRHHLHGDESGVGAGDRRLRLFLHPGVGGLPVGADQRTHLCHLEEARMSHHSIPVFPVNPCPTASVIIPPLKYKFWCLSTKWPLEPPGQYTPAKGG